MNTKNIENLEGFCGVVMIPVYETNAKNLVPIEFHGVSVASKVFHGKKDTYYVAEKYDCVHVFIGLGKKIDYKSLKNTFRRLASKEKDIFGNDVI